MFATYAPKFFSDGSPQDNRPVSTHKTLYGARQASKARKLLFGRLVSAQTCHHHTGISPAQYQMSAACHGEPSQYCRDAKVLASRAMERARKSMEGC